MQVRKGLTLLELVAVILVLGILAVVAAPKFFDTVAHATAMSELSNASAFLKAVEVFESQNQRLPNDAGPGSLPADLVALLPANMFANSSPAGGVYDWDGPPPHSTNELKLVLPSGTYAPTAAFYLKMEESADDNSATTGWIRASGRIVRFKY